MASKIEHVPGNMRPKRLSLKNVSIVLIAFVIIKAFLWARGHIFEPILTTWRSTRWFIAPTNFQIKASVLFHEVESDEDKFWMAHSKLKHVNLAIPIDKVLVQENSPSPETIYYDPRYTISVYLKELQRRGNTDTIPTLPFHWVDWTDTTWIDAESNLSDTGTSKIKVKSGNNLGKATTCKEIQGQIVDHPEYEYFCKDRDELSDDYISSLGYRDRLQLPKAVIYDVSHHASLSFDNVFKFMANSYTMAHLPKPYRVVILNDYTKGGTFEFYVNQTNGPDQRLLYNDMAGKFIREFVSSPEQKKFTVGGYVNIDVQNIFSNFQKRVRPRVLPAEQDILQKRQIIKGRHGTSKDIILQKNLFHYPREMIRTQIQQYSAIRDRSITQQSFLDGLLACSQYTGQTEPTYFKIPVVDKNKKRDSEHYDWRFFNDNIFHKAPEWTRDERVERTNIIVERLSRNWHRFTEEKGLVSWINFGPLLAWYWTGMIFPNDINFHVQMPITELVRLAQNWNQTLVVESPSEGYGRYLIDVGTYIHNRDRSLQQNHIDARFIDVDSGVYIEITGLAKSNYNSPEMDKKNPMAYKESGSMNIETYNDRSHNLFTLRQLSPLRYSMLSGVPVHIPHEIESRLEWLFGKEVCSPEYMGWYFVEKLQLWIYKDKLIRLFDEADYVNSQNKIDPKKFSALLGTLSDKKALELLQDDAILTEYYMTCKHTDWHAHEKRILFTKEGKDLPDLRVSYARRNYNNFVGTVGFSPPLRPSLFEYEVFERFAHH